MLNFGGVYHPFLLPRPLKRIDLPVDDQEMVAAVGGPEDLLVEDLYPPHTISGPPRYFCSLSPFSLWIVDDTWWFWGLGSGGF